VRLDYLTNPYWAKRFDGIRRVAAPAATPAPFDTPSYQAAAPQPERVAPVAQAAPAYAGTAALATQSTGVATNAATTPAPQADPFEPPPPGMSAAQMQARAAGAVSPAPQPAAQASAYDATAGVTSQQTAAARAPDPIDAAADAFEPPPPSASIAARQAQQAQQADGNAEGVRIMRASTASRGVPAPTQTTDDPIARFANGNF
jgi:hypothetical protein